MINFDPTQVRNSLQNYVNTLLVYENQKVSALQNQRTVLQQRSSAVSQVVSLLSSLKSSLTVTFSTKRTTLSEPSVASATASGKLLGTFDLTVESLAKNQRLNWAQLDSEAFIFGPNVTAGEHSFWQRFVGKSLTLTLTYGDGSVETVSVDLTGFNAESSVSQVVDQFLLQLNANTTKLRVFRQLLPDGTYALQSVALRSGKVGGLRGLSFQPEGEEAVSFDDPSALDGLNAVFTLNGYKYERSSNTFSDIVPNLTVTLKNAGSTTISVQDDPSSVADGFSSFVNAFRTFSDRIRLLMNADPSNQGALASESSTLRQLLDGLRTRLMTPRTVTVDGVSYTFNPSLIGISFDQYGSISLDTSKLNGYVQNNPKGLEILQAWWGDVSNAIKGYIDGALSSNGMVGRLQKAYSSSITNINKEISKLQAQIEERRKALTEQIGVVFENIYQYQSLFARFNSLFSSNSSGF
ncbi:flagellar filament capping protein FliD [Coprothermobacteraceae bacterium]|nr:flagellar filament capping protein FliD [Coprothermobacteraceae bacterium]